jgi:hypothetical protein
MFCPARAALGEADQKASQFRAANQHNQDGNMVPGDTAAVRLIALPMADRRSPYPVVIWL